MPVDVPKVWLLVLVGGCHRSYPLDEIPIVGGSEYVRQLVEDELASFSEAIEPASIELSEIVFEATDEGMAGWYRDRDRRIAIDEELATLYDEAAFMVIPGVLRHELCHALDYQTELAAEPHETLDAYADLLFDPQRGAQDWRDDPRSRRSEAFAEICGLGPILAASLAEPCPGESPLLAELASFALSDIWRNVTFGAPPVLVEPLVTSGPFEPFVGVSPKPTNQPDVLRLDVYHTDDSSTPYAVDLHSGEQADLQTDLETVPSVVEGLSLGWALDKSVAFTAAGWPDQALLGTKGFLLDAFDGEYPDRTRSRLLWFSGEGWSPFPVCPPDEDGSNRFMWGIFTAQDAVWYAYGDGQVVRWASVMEQSRTPL